MSVVNRKNDLLQCLAKPLELRKANGLIRKITSDWKRDAVDLCSNDYLGLARSEQLQDLVEVEYDQYKKTHRTHERRVGSTGSRLLTGNHRFYDQVEEYLCKFYNGQSSLLFNSGYDLNLGLFAAMPQPGDLVIFDELMHNSVREGLKLMRATSKPFKHNDVKSLRRVIDQHLQSDPEFKGNIIVSVESVYSMDGHCAPLRELCDLCDEYGASLVVDEAHGVGVFGESGRGLTCELGLEERVFCRVCTFGKAIGCHGAVLIGPSILREYMINYCRPLIYSTSLPTHSLITIKASHEFLEKQGNQRQAFLKNLIQHFCDQLASNPMLQDVSLVSPSAIQGIIVPGNDHVVQVSKALLEQHWHVMPIRSPTVPKGQERLRIILHYHNTTQQIDQFIHDLLQIIRTKDSPL